MRDLYTRGTRRAAYSLIELMVALGVFAVGSSIAYPLLVGDINLYTRNFSLNKSNNSLRYSLQMLKKDIDMAIEPPQLMTYRVSGGIGVLKPAIGSPVPVSAPAIMVWVNLGPAYDMVPTTGTGTGGTISPASGVTLKRHIYSSGYPTASSPVPQIGDRLVIMYPSPYSTGMPETVMMDGAPISKPGRAITSVSILPTDTTSTTFTVGLDQSNTALPSGIVGDKSVFIVREVAYVTYTISNSAGTAVERQLLYYPTTYNMANAKLLIRDLDPNPQEVDTTTNAVVQPFNFYGGRGNLSALKVILPIRAVDYASAIADRNLGGASTDTSATEFNVYLRSNPQLGIKARLD